MEPAEASLLFCAMDSLKRKSDGLKKRELKKKVKLSRRIAPLGGIRMPSAIDLIAKTKKASKRLKDSLLKQHLFCMICNDYFVSPVATNCSHTFCEQCIVEFVEKNGRCFQCDAPHYQIRVHPVKSVESSVNNFVSALNSEYLENYKRKVEAHKAWQETQKPAIYKQGDFLEFLGSDYLWHRGVVTKVIINKNHANTLQITDEEDKDWVEMICQNSRRLFRSGKKHPLESKSDGLDERIEEERNSREPRSDNGNLLRWILRAMQRIIEGSAGRE